MYILSKESRVDPQMDFSDLVHIKLQTLDPKLHTSDPKSEVKDPKSEVVTGSPNFRSEVRSRGSEVRSLHPRTSKVRSPQSRIRSPKFAAEDLHSWDHQLGLPAGLQTSDFRLQNLDPKSVDKDPKSEVCIRGP